MTKIAIVTSSIRPGRQSLAVATWIKSLADQRTDATFEIVDVADFNLPLWQEPASPAFAAPESAEGQAWAEKIREFDGFVFAVAEYNHSITGALKNAGDYLGPNETANKAAGFVSWGSAGGARAVEHLRNILAEQQVATVRGHVLLNLFTDFENFSVLKPSEVVTSGVAPMLDQVVTWTKAMEAVRAGQFAPEAVAAQA
jgi:NAD(P)H-dependent FMN reductase